MFEKPRRRYPGLFEVRPGNSRPRTLDSPAQKRQISKSKQQAMERNQRRQINTTKVSIGSQMSRRQPGKIPRRGKWTYVLISSFKKELKKGNQSVLVPHEIACPTRNPGRDEVRELENSAKTQLCYPRQIHRKVTSYGTNESPAFLPTCVGQNQHVWVKWL